MFYFHQFFIFLVWSIGSLNTSVASEKSYGSVTVDEVTSIYDGDTFRVNIHSWPKIAGKRMPVRINGIDTPELRAKCQFEKDLAVKAKQFTVSMLRSANKIELMNIKRGKYFRIIADVLIDRKDLAKSLIAKGLAVKYDGGTKVDWCEKD
ncbi:nuclease [Hydrogenovibrio crunogenus]|uniref:Nuclease n=1 Tax=Hydrogenovibrio crunogenus TaxID=39765 RepID=A0A4P7NXI6_9GAMM|nr:thermonuclease family protein [Hydrogenovibrio crunogenus]QBZ82175.1 nuclease [Hydrogenovibrio crunogenus]